MRLLLIEDFDPLRKSLAKGLQEAGFAVDATGDGSEGLWLAQGSNYDLIILDVMLPGTDGLTILRRLREAGRDMHVLILTAKDTIGDRIRGLDLGADDYMVKPFSFGELLARVHALLRRRYERKDPFRRIGPLRIDTASRRVWREDQEVSLSSREYALLEYLAMREGQIVSRTDIWEHIYDADSEAASNVVDVYVGYLRRKIDPPDGPSLIRTVRGMGYCLGGQP